MFSNVRKYIFWVQVSKILLIISWYSLSCRKYYFVLKWTNREGTFLYYCWERNYQWKWVFWQRTSLLRTLYSSAVFSLYSVIYVLKPIEMKLDRFQVISTNQLLYRCICSHIWNMKEIVDHISYVVAKLFIMVCS